MTKKVKRRKTVNIGIYEDTHNILKQHSYEDRQSIAGIVHSLAMNLVAAKRK